MSRIFVDTGPLRGVVWAHDKYHKSSEQFFAAYPVASHDYFYCDTVKSELMGFVRRLEALPLDRSGHRQVKNMRKTITAFFKAMERVEYTQEPDFSPLFEAVHELIMARNRDGKEPNQSNDAKIVTHALICAEKDGPLLLTTIDGKDIADNERPFNKLFYEKVGGVEKRPLHVVCLD